MIDDLIGIPKQLVDVNGLPISSVNIQTSYNKPLTLQPSDVMKLWRAKPKIFFKDAFDVTLDAWQEDCAELYLTHQRLGLIASKGPGKTALLAFLGWHFFATNYRPKMAALSVTKEHLKANLWAELLRWRAQSKLLTASEIHCWTSSWVTHFAPA